jgi:hypothetical protein
MKLNFSSYIIFAFIAFGAFIVTLVVKTFAFKPELVSKNYYEEELQYQHTINSKDNVTRDSMHVKLDFSNNQVLLEFPEKTNDIKGSIHLLRPSDESLDRHIPIVLNKKNCLLIPTSNIQQGLYLLKIKWTSNGVEYFQEQNISI